MVPKAHSIGGSKCYGSQADPIPGHEGANGIVKAAPNRRVCLRDVVDVSGPRRGGGVRLCHRPRNACTGPGRRRGHHPTVEPAANVPPQVMPRCSSPRRTTPARDVSIPCCTTSTTPGRSKDWIPCPAEQLRRSPGCRATADDHRRGARATAACPSSPASMVR